MTSMYMLTIATDQSAICKYWYKMWSGTILILIHTYRISSQHYLRLPLVRELLAVVFEGLLSRSIMLLYYMVSVFRPPEVGLWIFISESRFSLSVSLCITLGSLWGWSRCIYGVDDRVLMRPWFAVRWTSTGSRIPCNSKKWMPNPIKSIVASIWHIGASGRLAAPIRIFLCICESVCVWIHVIYNALVCTVSAVWIGLSVWSRRSSISPWNARETRRWRRCWK